MIFFIVINAENRNSVIVFAKYAYMQYFRIQSRVYCFQLCQYFLTCCRQKKTDQFEF